MSISEDVRHTEQVLATLSLCHNNVGNSFRRVSKFLDAKVSDNSAMVDIPSRIPVLL